MILSHEGKLNPSTRPMLRVLSFLDFSVVAGLLPDKDACQRLRAASLGRLQHNIDHVMADLHESIIKASCKRQLPNNPLQIKEDLLSAIKLGSQIKVSDSDVSETCSKTASTKARKIDVKGDIAGALKYWLRGTAGLIILTITLLQIPDFGSDLKLLMQRAIMPGSNLPPVTSFDVRILAPDENVTRTPSNEPLRFVALIKPKKEGNTFKRITLETKTIKDSKEVTLTKRNPERFFVDYNVGNQEFEYRILVDQAPQTEWRKMDVGATTLLFSVLKEF